MRAQIFLLFKDKLKTTHVIKKKSHITEQYKSCKSAKLQKKKKKNIYFQTDTFFWERVEYF